MNNSPHNPEGWEAAKKYLMELDEMEFAAERDNIFVHVDALLLVAFEQGKQEERERVLEEVLKKIDDEPSAESGTVTKDIIVDIVKSLQQPKQ